jgi:thiamine biosynthesis lipoprotein
MSVPTTPGVAEVHERAMGSTVHVIVHAGAQQAQPLARLALRRIAMLEQCWSRFRPDSELSNLNARAGTGPVPVSADLATLVDAMLTASAATANRFDPTVHDSMRALGYDADFAAVIGRAAVAAAAPIPAGGVTGIVLDLAAGTVTLPAGCAIDPGAIGKGLAADLVAKDLHDAGATGVLVNLGGDLAAYGTAGDDPWVIGVRDDRLPDSPTVGTLTLGPALRAVATTSSLRRRWAGQHHVLDPRTGRPLSSDLAQVTVAAPDGARAESAATAALLMGADAAASWLSERDLPALLFPHDPSLPPTRTLELSHA